MHGHQQARHRARRVLRKEVSGQRQSVQERGELGAVVRDAARAQEVSALRQHGARVRLRALEHEQRASAALARVASGSAVELDVQAWRAGGRRRRQGGLAGGCLRGRPLPWPAAGASCKARSNSSSGGGARAGGETCGGARGVRLRRGGEQLVDRGVGPVQPLEVLLQAEHEGHVARALGRRGVEDGRAGRRDRVHHAQGALQQGEGEEDQLVGLAVGGGVVRHGEVCIERVPARQSEHLGVSGQALLKRERVPGAAVRARHVEADVGVGVRDPAAVPGREPQRADGHVRVGHGGAERLRGESAQRAEGGVVAALLTPDRPSHLLAASSAGVKVLAAAVSRVGDQQPARAPGGVQGVRPRLHDHLGPEVGAEAVPVPVDVVDQPLQLREANGAAQAGEGADQRRRTCAPSRCLRIRGAGCHGRGCRAAAARAAVARDTAARGAAAGAAARAAAACAAAAAARAAAAHSLIHGPFRSAPLCARGLSIWESLLRIVTRDRGCAGQCGRHARRRGREHRALR